jgi:hypothetical protein
MANGTKIIGYEVETCDGYFVIPGGDIDDCVDGACSIGEAYLRVSEYLERNPTMPVPTIHTVERSLTPLESSASELGNLLSDLLNRNGLDLGLTQNQINTQIAKELASLGAKKS